jgi:hypothetical protein
MMSTPRFGRDATENINRFDYVGIENATEVRQGFPVTRPD